MGDNTEKKLCERSSILKSDYCQKTTNFKKNIQVKTGIIEDDYYMPIAVVARSPL